MTSYLIKMKLIFSFCVTFCIFNVVISLTSQPLLSIDFRKEAAKENFNIEELKLLEPIIEIFQNQYNRQNFTNIESSTKPTYEDQSSFKNLIQETLLKLTNDDPFTSYKYNVDFPSKSLLNSHILKNLPADEAYDLKNIFEETIEDAIMTIQELIEQLFETESQLLSINSIKIVKFVYKMLELAYGKGINIGRVAYCTYSYFPLINSTINEGSQNIGACYNYTTTSIIQLRKDVQNAINEIRGNVTEIVTIYKKIASRKSILGKLFTILLNISKITNDITQSRSKVIKTIEELKTESPVIIDKSKKCATESVPSFVKQLNATINELTFCIQFVDDSTQGPEQEPESSEDISSEEIV